MNTMSTDGLFSGSKWEILKVLAQKETSPIELARTLDTTVANVSTQLRLLELAHFITKIRVPNALAGQPRVLYRLKKDIVHVAAATTHAQFKQQLDVTQHSIVMLHISRLPREVQGPLMACYVSFPQLFESHNSVYYADHGDRVISLIVSNNKKPLPPKILNVEFWGQRVGIEVDFFPLDKIPKFARLLQLGTNTA